MGDIYVGSGDFLFHDRRIPLPQFEAFGIARIPAAKVPRRLLRSASIREGVISTGDSFTPSAEELRFFNREDVPCKEMEAAALAGMARDINLPFVAIKAVTDLVDHPEPEELAFTRNLSRVSQILEDDLVRVIACL